MAAITNIYDQLRRGRRRPPDSLMTMQPGNRCRRANPERQLTIGVGTTSQRNRSPRKRDFILNPRRTFRTR